MEKYCKQQTGMTTKKLSLASEIKLQVSRSSEPSEVMTLLLVTFKSSASHRCYVKMKLKSDIVW